MNEVNTEKALVLAAAAAVKRARTYDFEGREANPSKAAGGAADRAALGLSETTMH